MDNFWPISISLPKYPVWQDGITLLALGVGFWLFLKVFIERKSLQLLAGAGLLLIMGTNLLQGYQGLYEPLTASDSYWADSLKITNLASFLEFYETLQPTLALHSRSHPPGPIVLVYLLSHIAGQPLFASLVLAAIGSGVVFLLYDFLRQKNVSADTAFFVSALFLVLPTVQIYFISSFDAIMPLVFFSVFWAWQRAKEPKWLVTTGVLFALALSFNFAAIFLIPILLFDDWRRHGQVNLSLQLFVASIILGFLVAILFGYNYWNSFLIGVRMESQGGGFFLLRDPLSYVVTRLENVLEIAIFFSPWLSYLLLLSFKTHTPWKRKQWRSDFAGAFTALVSLTGFFLAGGYYTGETARNTNYIYPFLLIMLGFFVRKKPLTKPEQVTLLTLVFGQSLVMQLFGWYGW
jgi:hypothetical protein